MGFDLKNKINLVKRRNIAIYVSISPKWFDMDKIISHNLLLCFRNTTRKRK